MIGSYPPQRQQGVWRFEMFPKSTLDGKERVAEFERYAATIRERLPKIKIEPFPDTHEPFGWDLKPTYDWED